MMTNRIRNGALALTLAMLPVAALAQTAAPTPEALTLARDLVVRTSGDRDATLQSISGPMVGMMQQMGIREPDRAKAVVDEAVMPILTAHYDDLVTLKAKAYASVLSIDDMKAIGVFYNTKAGQSLIRAQPQLAQAQLTGMTQWMSALQPEMQTKIQQIVKSHGWDKG